MKQKRLTRCGKCRQKTVDIAVIPYDIRIDHDGKKYDVHLDNLRVPKCTNCSEISIDESAEEQIDLAFREKARLLTSKQIRFIRSKYGNSLSQQEFADWLGIGVSTLSRWETGAQVQQRFCDDMLRAFAALPEFRAYLALLHGVRIPMFLPISSRLIDIGGNYQGITFVATPGPMVRPDPFVERLDIRDVAAERYLALSGN